MGRRGRRPHPDILTPREWEVLDLLRERLTNEQIAERLGITLDGAKYHVSEILSKLGVTTREEAAGWLAAASRPWWQRLVALPVAARIAGAATLIAAAAGLAVLAWGESRTNGPDSSADEDFSALPRPPGDVRLTRDAALVKAAGTVGGDIRGVQAEVAVTTLEEARKAMGDTGYSPYDPALETATWIVRFRGRFPDDAFRGFPNFSQSGSVSTPVTTRSLCGQFFVSFLDAGAGYTGVSGGGETWQSCPASTDKAPMTRDEALVLATHNPEAKVHLGASLREADLQQTTLDDALSALMSFGWDPEPPDDSPPNSTSIWLALVIGPYLPPRELAPPSPPGPSAHRLVCRQTATIVDALSGAILFNDYRTASGCYRPSPNPPPALGPADTRVPVISDVEAIDEALRRAGIPTGQSPDETSVRLMAFEQTGFTCTCYPPHTEYRSPDTPAYVVTFRGMLTEPVDPAAPATPPAAEPRCSELIVVLSSSAGSLWASLFQHSDSCS